MGILLFSRAAVLAGARLPRGLRTADVLTVGVAASIGFTVSLFFATAAFPEGRALAETKMGALLSFVAAPLAFAASRVLRGRMRTQAAL
jgi:NhaA family Na+:H+ antiporter